MPALPYKDVTPTVAESAFIAPNAWVTGDVTIAEDASIFFGASLRGDLMPIIVGRGSNIQDNAILHTTHDYLPCIVGNYVTVGHGAILHACTVEENCIIGMGATILDGAVIGKNSMVGANSLVTMETKIPEGSMVFGSPAKVQRALTEKELKELHDSALRYIDVAREYKGSI